MVWGFAISWVAASQGDKHAECKLGLPLPDISLLRKVLVSVNVCPQFWAGNGCANLKCVCSAGKPCPENSRFRGEGYFGFWGGGRCRFHFYGREDFSDLHQLSRKQLCSGTKRRFFKVFLNALLSGLWRSECHMYCAVQYPFGYFCVSCFAGHYIGFCRNPLYMGKSGTIWQFVCAFFLALGGHCLQMLCLPGFGTHANIHLPHFCAFPASTQEHSPRNADFSWQMLNCLCPPTCTPFAKTHNIAV